MRGEVLHYDEDHGFGFITGENGKRYAFRREDLRRFFPPSRGIAVEFRDSGDQARDVSLPVTAPQAPAIAKEPPRLANSLPTPVTAPVARPPSKHFGREAAGNDASHGQASVSLWDHFRAGVTTNYANFRGRARRKEYWGFALFYTLGMILLSVAGVAIDAAIGNFDDGLEAPVATIVLILVFLLAGMVPGIAISVRRFHDIGLSGWFYPAMFVVGVLLAGSVMILAIILGLIPSQKRENRWGPAPDGVDTPQGG
jgi:uncharacterized membrane protein YhaH (DUF805 family)/cold shock CspA family protein